jgi:DNA-binding response OmpR family regulator
MLVEDDYELASLIRDFLLKYEFNVSIVNDTGTNRYGGLSAS